MSEPRLTSSCRMVGHSALAPREKPVAAAGAVRFEQEFGSVHLHLREHHFTAQQPQQVQAELQAIHAGHVRILRARHVAEDHALEGDAGPEGQVDVEVPFDAEFTTSHVADTAFDRAAQHVPVEPHRQQHQAERDHAQQLDAPDPPLPSWLGRRHGSSVSEGQVGPNRRGDLRSSGGRKQAPGFAMNYPGHELRMKKRDLRK